MIAFPNSKINLGLWVIRERIDGFHEIQTVFVPVDFCDILEIVPLKSDRSVIEVSGIDTGIPAKENLCMKACQAMQEKYGLPGVAIHLHKMVPPGSGLGGGSSDAAFTLKMLNEIFDVGLDRNELAGIAAGIGSDCPFFIYNRPMSASGRGEILQEVEIATGMNLVIVVPPVHVSTSEAYSMVGTKVRDVSLQEVVALPLDNWKNSLANDFEPTVFERYPQIRETKDRLYSMGAVYASMSGSGSAVFGLFKSQPTSLDEFRGCVTWQGTLV